jgi:tetratricopeptide (TPR) repeat protein
MFSDQNMKKPIILLFVIGLIVVAVFSIRRQPVITTKQAAPSSPQALAIEHLGLPEFAPGLVEVEVTSPADRAKYEKMNSIFTVIGDGKDANKNAQAIQMLDRFIGDYPDNPDAYSMRATLTSSSPNPDYSKILSDLNLLEHLNKSNGTQSSTTSPASIMVMRAKVHLLTKNDQQAISDLEEAIKSDPTKSPFNNGGVKAEEDTADRSAIQNSDFEYLVSHFPNDSRVYMARGLFFQSFTSYSEDYFAPAFANLNRAQSLNPNSALVEYLLGSLYLHSTFLTKAAWREISESGGFKDQQNRLAFEHLQRASSIDPDFVEAWAQEAEALYSLKEYKEAIPYYDKVIALAPSRWEAFNDRGLAKFNSGDYYGAISDYTDALNIKKQNHISNSPLDSTYESRADAYSKVENYDAAIADYGRAIGLKLSSTIFLMSLGQIRGAYPELHSISDSDLLEGLRVKYYPNMSSSDFVGQYQKNIKPFDEFILAGLYENRGDAYLASGDFRNAGKEYDRARHMDANFIMERWKSISKSPEKDILLDMQTIDVTNESLVSIWIKRTAANSSTYSEEKLQIDCVARKMRVLGYANYNAAGNLTSSRDTGTEWELIVPETIGERFAHGACPR